MASGNVITRLIGGGSPPSGVLGTSIDLNFNGGLGSGGTFGQVNLAPDGTIWFAEAMKMIIRKWDPVTGYIYTVVGSGLPGYAGDGGQVLAASFSNPQGVCWDASGNYYIADCDNYVIRKVTSAGIVSTIAGNNVRAFSGDGGPATSASLNKPRGVQIDCNGDLLIADTDNHRIRKVNLVSLPVGDINTIIGGGASTAEGAAPLSTRLEYPFCVKCDPNTNDMYFTAYGGSVPGADYKIRKLKFSDGLVYTVVGTGTSGYSGDGGAATSAKIKNVYDLDFDAVNNLMYFGDNDNNVIRVVNLTTGIIDHYAGTTYGFTDDCDRLVCQLSNTKSLVLTATHMYIVDRNNKRLRQINLSTGYVTTVCGGGADSTINCTIDQAIFNYPYAAMYGGSILYISEYGRSRILKADFTNDLVTLLAGTTDVPGFEGDGGPATSAKLNSNYQLCVGPISGNIYVADLNNHRIRVITAAGIINTYAGSGSGSHSGDGGLATSAGVPQPISCCCDAAENLYISSYGSSRIRKVNYTTKIITTFAGTGTAGSAGDGGLATLAQLNRPYQCFITPNGSYMYIADRLNHRIRQINMSTNIITKAAGTTTGFSGDDGPATSAQLDDPRGCCADNYNFYIADTENLRIRRVRKVNGKISTCAGTGNSTPVEDGDAVVKAVPYPSFISRDANGDLIYTDYASAMIRKIEVIEYPEIKGALLVCFDLPYKPSEAAADRPIISLNESDSLNNSVRFYIDEATDRLVMECSESGSIVGTISANILGDVSKYTTVTAVVVWSGDGISLYVNGSLEGTVAAEPSSAHNRIEDGSDLSTSDRCDGNMFAVVYFSELTAAEALALSAETEYWKTAGA